MAEDFYKGKASMLGKGISSLSRAIEENARDIVSTVGNYAENPVEAAKTVGDIISGGIGALDLANIVNLNPVLAAGKGIYDISRMSEKYNQQKIDDLAKYGRETTSLGTFARSLPIVGGIASLFSGPNIRRDLNPEIKRYLAERGIDPNDWRGGNQRGPTMNPLIFNPASTPVAQAPLAAPWVNPNLPDPNQTPMDDESDDGYTIDDIGSYGGDYDGMGPSMNKGGIASLSA